MSGPAYLGNPHDHPIWQELADALDEAMTKHPPMHSPHEGFAVLYEELVVELGEHVWHDTGTTPEARKEAIQVAAMGLRYALDLCFRERPDGLFEFEPEHFTQQAASELEAALLRLYDAAEGRPDIRAAIQPFLAAVLRLLDSDDA